MAPLPRDLHSQLARYHPVVIEGMGGYDQRDPIGVASQVAEQLSQHWARKPPRQPLLIVTQGDPLEARGISAITPRVADHFGIPRGLVCLDEHIAPYHSPNADRQNVIVEMRYSQLAEALDCFQPGTVASLEAAVDAQIIKKNWQRQAQGKQPLKDYFRNFALLQEVTKAACSRLCGDITIIQTSSDINEFSVTSFFTVGLELGLVNPGDMVPVAAS